MKTKICYETHRHCNGSTCDVSASVFQQYPTQLAVAIRRSYPRGWKCGEMPKREVLGRLLFPIGEGIEQAEARVRRAFPDATDSRLYDETGSWFCAGSLS